MTFRKRIEAAYDLDSAEPTWLAIFDEACAVEETLAELRAVVKSDGLLASGSKNQVRVHPAVAEIRAQQAHLAKMLIQLDLVSTSQQQRAARKRWDR